jgi:succinate-semialdehyde dehydrogenase/glutarate-semialdehyde dehydrogenase
MARADLAVQLKKQVDASVTKGASLICGGNHKDALFEPTLLTNVKPGMPAFDEEIFGPVLCVIVAKDENDAVTLANASRFGLGGSVWTQNKERGLSVARRVESGSVYVNTLMKSDQRLPFGGTKKSGYGRELSKEGIREFVNVKSVMVN